MQLSVIVPCFNEEGNLDILVGRLRACFQEHGIDGEIVLVNDGSRDRTGEVVDELARRFQNVVPVHHAVNKGIVEGWRSGLKNASAPWVCTIDADLQYLPEDCARLYAEMQRTGADLVQGWRRWHTSINWQRYLLSKGFSGFLNALFRMRLRDIKSGFILYKREAFADVMNFRGPYHAFQHFPTIAARKKGYRIVQIPVVWNQRHAGQSFIQMPWRFALRSLRDLPRALDEFGGRPPRP
ncbi:MAG: glycosyltransferase family 2 protein [Candidatus Methylomirabilis sp.]|nr:glycosyltransferase family 2 protein [Deltaproteobacteria bacterium]